MSHLTVESLPEPGDRYVLGDVLGIGVWAKVVIVAYYMGKCFFDKNFLLNTGL